MTTLPPYKGFQASIEYDEGVLFIRILHISDTISAICQKASEVLPTFRDLVDDYIQTCVELGENPDRPFKGSFNVRVNPGLHRNAAMAAAACQVTMNSWIADAIRDKIERETAERGYLFRDLDIHENLEVQVDQPQNWAPEKRQDQLEADVVQIDRYRVLAEQKNKMRR
jgi:predicted HicB family RNase H-like nuclease